MNKPTIYNPDADMTDIGWRDYVKDGMPGFMRTGEGSNTSKVLDVMADIANVYKNDLLKFTADMNIDNASGDLLTRIAADYDVARIDQDDNFLRFEVKFAMYRNAMAPNIDDLAKAMGYLLRINPHQFTLVKTGLKEFRIDNVPWNFQTGSHVELKRTMVASIVQEIAPPEFKLDYINYIKKNSTTVHYANVTAKTLFRHVKPEPMANFQQYFNKE